MTNEPEKRVNNPDHHHCVSCDIDDDTVTFGPDPYASSVHGDDTPVWECLVCRNQSAMSI